MDPSRNVLGVAMSDFVLTWKPAGPRGWPHSELMKLVRKCRRRGFVKDNRRFFATQKAKPGDRVFLLQQGTGPKIIFGLGEVKAVYPRGTDPSGSTPGTADIRFYRLVDPTNEQPIVPEHVVESVVPKAIVETQFSGRELPNYSAAKLEKYLAGDMRWPSDLLSEITPEEVLSVEGRRRLVTHLIRERDGALANRKKQAVFKRFGKLVCEACNFDFHVSYGKLGERFCEVHHRVAVADGVKENRLADLAVLCSNCHRMIHHTEPMLSVKAFAAKHVAPHYT